MLQAHCGAFSYTECTPHICDRPRVTSGGGNHFPLGSCSLLVSVTSSQCRMTSNDIAASCKLAVKQISVTMTFHLHVTALSPRLGCHRMLSTDNLLCWIRKCHYIPAGISIRMTKTYYAMSTLRTLLHLLALFRIADPST